ncbi:MULTISPECIES: FAD-dependent oxidoreductase [Rhodobacterales]|uniref:FAD-dependent oxidoreductase n=1 Tax=Cognatishimia coralii TaxID=3083254 RepID=A0ABU8QKC2_9RHOB|nr:FAD-dependent oxidoreductase [Shimia aestuarii]
MPVEFSIVNGSAILTINNPPLNLINAEVRAGIERGISRAHDSGASRLIITGAGTTFVAGADANEFGKPPHDPQLNDVLLKLAQLSIPTIAAINGVALGGGLEIALACRFRIAAPAARLGLPEVILGMVPGAGGTQRLPRLIGIESALDMIVSGQAVSATRAINLGMIQQLAEDPLEAALALDAADLAKARAPDHLPAPLPDDAALAAAHTRAKRRMAGQDAPQIAADLIKASASMQFAEALQNERSAFLTLRKSDQARSLRHVFFSERAAANKARIFPCSSKKIETAVVVGGGNMGAAIAYTLASAGISVTVVERDTASAEWASNNLHELVNQGVKRGVLQDEAAQAIVSRLATAVGYANLPQATLAIEAAFENFDVKCAILNELEAVLPHDAVLATNTSYLDVNRLAEGLKNPDRFVGLHFFSPAHIMKLLEIVRGNQTSDNTLGIAFDLASRLNKVPVLSGVCDGFIGNRILSSYRQAAIRLLVEGASVEQIDTAMRDFGMAMGPFSAQDMSGLDIAYANIQRRSANKGLDEDHVPLVEQMVEEHNRLGRKSGAGWYDYDAEGRSSASSTVAAEISQISEDLTIPLQTFRSEEIVDRLVLTMLTEACDILEEGIAEQPRDIDLVMIHGYGFPRWRGGLMHYAQNVGEARVRALYDACAEKTTFSWKTPRNLDLVFASA